MNGGLKKYDIMDLDALPEEVDGMVKAQKEDQFRVFS
jgi:hypothetical protein